MAENTEVVAQFRRLIAFRKELKRAPRRPSLTGRFQPERLYWVQFTRKSPKVRGVDLRIETMDGGPLAIVLAEDRCMRPDKILTGTEIVLPPLVAQSGKLQSLSLQLDFKEPVEVDTFFWIGLRFSRGIGLSVDPNQAHFGYISRQDGAPAEKAKDGDQTRLLVDEHVPFDLTPADLPRPRLTIVYQQ